MNARGLAAILFAACRGNDLPGSRGASRRRIAFRPKSHPKNVRDSQKQNNAEPQTAPAKSRTGGRANRQWAMSSEQRHEPLGGNEHGASAMLLRFSTFPRHKSQGEDNHSADDEERRQTPQRPRRVASGHGKKGVANCHQTQSGGEQSPIGRPEPVVRRWRLDLRGALGRRRLSVCGLWRRIHACKGGQPRGRQPSRLRPRSGYPRLPLCKRFAGQNTRTASAGEASRAAARGRVARGSSCARPVPEFQ